MFEPGNLLYFNPFIFPDGGDPKPKFFVVLGEVEETVLLASLPTSKDHIPSDVEVASGCLDASMWTLLVPKALRASCATSSLQ
jgi:hypothetical protein